MKERIEEKLKKVNEEMDLWLYVLEESNEKETLKRAEEILHDLRVEKYLLLDILEG